MKSYTLLLIALMIFVSGCGWTEGKVKVSMKRGNLIIKALDKYKVNHGKYPETLTMLVPAFFKKIPQPAAGNKKWAYIVDPDKKDFYLGFEGNNKEIEPEYCYDTKSKRWCWDTK